MSNIVQIILDRIIFIRICEGKEIEPENFLLNLVKDKESSFWDQFINYSQGEFAKHYDGPLFSNNNGLEDIIIKGSFFKDFIKSLYYPYPYKFDVIPIDLIGNIYEKFLGFKIFIKGNKIEDGFKPEYQRTKGAIYTPRYIVDDICNRVLSPLVKGQSIEKILQLKICDPACGSGSFLLGVYDFLESKIIDIYSKNPNRVPSKYKEWFYKDSNSDTVLLTTYAKRAIIENCIYGVDLDAQAVEVARMALALKILENSETQVIHLNELGLRDREILKGIGKNIRRGNSLVDSSAKKDIPGLVDDIDLLKSTLPFDYWDEKNFKDVKVLKGGFDGIVGNPPYIETKHFKEHLPAQHEFVKNNYETGRDGKTDIAVPFIEKSLVLLNKNGRMGFIVQNRFFKTDYGKAARNLLDGSKVIDEIIDFGELKIFQGRMTYTCTLILDKSHHDYFNYYKVDSLDGIWELLQKIGKSKNISILHGKFKTGSLGKGSWSFSHPELIELKTDLSDKFGTLKDVTEIDIKVGLQVLWDKIYHIIPQKVNDGILIGKNRNGELIEIEEESCVKMVCNENFYTWRTLKPDVYAIFPYEIVNGKVKPLSENNFSKKFPLCGAYLKERKKIIKENVQTPKDKAWIQYTRVQNLIPQSKPKILIPSTIVDTVCTFDITGEFYQDNVRINAIQLSKFNEKIYWTISAIINSNIFNMLAKISSGNLQGDYIQLNKQFLEPIPFPWNNIINKKEPVAKMIELVQKIIERQNSVILERDKESKEILKDSLRTYWSELDTIIEDDFYELSKEQKKIVKKYPRTLDRVDLLENINDKH